MYSVKTVAFLFITFAIIFNAKSESEWSKWGDLAKLKPNAKELIANRVDRGHDDDISYEVQLVTNGSGKAIDIDEYVVQIDKLPDGKNKT